MLACSVGWGCGVLAPHWRICASLCWCFLASDDAWSLCRAGESRGVAGSSALPLMLLGQIPGLTGKVSLLAGNGARPW